MIVTKKETVASLALLVLAGLFLYLGFTQERPQWAEIAKSPQATAAKTTTRVTAPAAGTKAAPAQTSAPQGTSAPKLPTPAQNPLEGPAANKRKEKSGEEFFVEYRLERDRVRSREIEMLREVIDNPNSSPQVRNEAQQRLIRLSEYMEQEMQLEALLQAKGYPEAAVFIQPSTVNVIVRAPQLKDEDVNRIGELVARTTGRRQEQVVIMPWP